jgi:YD repeat-containing protein
MKKLTWISVLLLFFSCKKDNDPRDLRLLKIEATDYHGDVVNTEYQYDKQGRIISISKKKNNEQSVVVVTVGYNGNEVLMLSTPDFDPAYTITTEVHLTLDGTGKAQKRIEYTHRAAKNPAINPSQEFRYDTSINEYDASGLLQKTTRSRRDSVWVQQDYIIKRKFDFTVNYTNTGGNLVSRDEYVTYPYTTTQGGVTTISGGSSEYHNVFSYTKPFSNQTDFKNAFVLNEYPFFNYDPPLNNNYKNMPDQVGIHNIDRDINGNIIFNANGTISLDRAYDSKGFLASITIPPGNTQDTKINFFYGRK